MRALDIIGVDFELRFGVDLRVGRQQQMYSICFAIGLLCFRVNVDLAVEDSVRCAIEDSFVDLMAGWQFGRQVLDPCLVVNVLRAIDEVQTIEGDFAPGPGQGR